LIDTSVDEIRLRNVSQIPAQTDPPIVPPTESTVPFPPQNFNSFIVAGVSIASLSLLMVIYYLLF
ncbi:hypothetical protein, partial [Salmonella sp. s51228]|uniref:hypothetical protein n=1 Tax=Salmonella sp. s51228 TaxID=3159652 RepID=UPI003980F815